MLPRPPHPTPSLLLRVGLPLLLCITLSTGFVSSARCQVDVDDALISPGEIAFLTVDITAPRALNNLHIQLSPVPGNIVRMDKTSGYTRFLDPRHHWKPSFLVEALNPGEVTIFVDVYDSTGVVCSTREKIRVVPITQNPEPQKPEIEILKIPKPNKLKVGEELTITIRIENLGRVEARNIIVEDQMMENVPTIGETRREFPSLGRGEKLEFSYSYKPEKIGRYTLPPAKVVYSYANNITVEAESIAPLVEILPKPGEEPPTEPVTTGEELSGVEAMNMVLRAETALQRAEQLHKKLVEEGVVVPTAVAILLDSAHQNLGLAKQLHSKGEYEQTIVMSTLSEDSANQAYQTLLEISKSLEEERRTAKILEQARKSLDAAARIAGNSEENPGLAATLEEAREKLWAAEESYKAGKYSEAGKLAGETIKLSQQLMRQQAEKKCGGKQDADTPGFPIAILGFLLLILAKIFAGKKGGEA